MTRGGRFGTIAPKVCVAVNPSSSVAVTVTLAAPFATAMIDTMSSVTMAAITVASLLSTA